MDNTIKHPSLDIYKKFVNSEDYTITYGCIFFIFCQWPNAMVGRILVVGPVLKEKNGFRGFETERNPGFRKCAEIW